MATLLSSGNNTLLSKRGSVSVDTRTNALWIRDTARNLKGIVHLIKRLDFPVKQVVIEARVVTVEKKFERNLGAAFGISSPRHLSGTLKGANQLAQGISTANVTPIAQRLNFDLPAGNSIFGVKAQAGSIALAALPIGGVTTLDLELSALEQEGIINLISTPRLITSNQYPAYIKTGEEIPYQESTSSGATSVAFKDAVLELKVTPQITPDNRIILNLTVSNNRAGIPIKLGKDNSAIPIATEEESSRVLLNDHQTVVLGGVYQQTKTKVVTRIPFLGRIPLLGYLFRRTINRTIKRELLIFLTPHIVHKPSDLS